MPAPSPDVLTLNSGEPIVRAPELSLSANREKGRETLRELVMAWARDRSSGEPRYIGELTRDQRGYRSNCECWSCGLPLQAVNPGRTTCIRRPHFRHPKGAMCLGIAQRLLQLIPLFRMLGDQLSDSAFPFLNKPFGQPCNEVLESFTDRDLATGFATFLFSDFLQIAMDGGLRASVTKLLADSVDGWIDTLRK
jgi:hypothetical protein